jgi:hypothetical protein
MRSPQRTMPRGHSMLASRRTPRAGWREMCRLSDSPWYKSSGWSVAMLLLTIPLGLRGASAGVTLCAAIFRTPSSGVQQGASGTGPKPSGQQNGGDQPQTESAMDRITIQFGYDLTEKPACAANVKATCVQISVYDISGGKPYFLFAVPVPQNAHGVMKRITASSHARPHNPAAQGSEVS